MVHWKQATILAVLTATSAGILTSCRSSAPPPSPIPVVPVATVATASLANDLALSAEFRPYQDVDVMAKVAGYVKVIRVDIGDHVRQGEILAILEAPEIGSDVARARAGIAAAEANIVTAQAAVQRAAAGANMATLSFQRIQEVANRDKGLVPRQEVDIAQSRQMEAAAQLASARSAVQAAQEAKSGAQSEFSRAQTLPVDADYSLAQKLATRIRDVHGIADVYIPQDLDYPSLRIAIDRTRASQLGLTQKETVLQHHHCTHLQPDDRAQHLDRSQ